MSANKKIVIDTEQIGFIQFISSRYGISDKRAEEITEELKEMAQAGTVDGLTVMDTPSSDLTVVTDEVLEGNVIDPADVSEALAIHDAMEDQLSPMDREVYERLLQDLGFPQEEASKPFRIGFNRS